MFKKEKQVDYKEIENQEISTLDEIIENSQFLEKEKITCFLIGIP